MIGHVGHGWVTPLPHGEKARCGGPGLCPQCATEAGTFKRLPIQLRYQWLVDKLEALFPGRITSQTWDYGSKFGVAYGSEGGRMGFYVEFEVHPDTGQKVLYSLNDDPDKDKKVEYIIKRFREIHDSA